MDKIFLVLVLVNFCTLKAFSGEPDKEFHEHCLYPTVMIAEMEIAGEEKKLSSKGTGLIIRSEKTIDGKYDNFVITCDHVILKENTSILSLLTNPSIVVRKANYVNWSVFEDFSDFDCKIIYRNVQADIAILYFESDEKMPVGEIDMNPELYIGNDIFRIGCGLGEVMKTDYGKITAVKHDMSETLKGGYRTSTPTIMGDSGGPAFHKTETGYKCFGLSQAVRGGAFESKVALSEGHLSVLVPYYAYHISFILPLNRVPDLLDKSQKKIVELKMIDLKEIPIP